MSSTTPLDICGRRRSPATLPDFHQGRPPRNKGLRYPADPPTVEEIIAVMRAAGDDADAVRLRGLVVVLWRAGLRVSEALALTESDLDPTRGAILVRHGKGGKRREVGMDRWGWQQLDRWIQLRATLPVGAVLRPTRPDARPRVGTSRHPLPAARGCQPGGGSPPVCAAPAATRARGGDVPRGCAAASSNGNSAIPIWLSPPCICAGRQHRDRPRRPRAAGADDPGDKRAEAPDLIGHYRWVVSRTSHRLLFHSCQRRSLEPWRVGNRALVAKPQQRPANAVVRSGRRL